MKGSGDKSKGKKIIWFDAEHAINRAQRVWRESIDEFFTKLDEVITEGDDYYRDTQANRYDEYYQGPFKLLESRLVACKAVHSNKVSLSKNKTTHVSVEQIIGISKSSELRGWILRYVIS